MNTNEITDEFFSIANTVGIYRKKHSIGIYRGNHKRNIKNFKKPNNAVTCKFLWMILPMELQWDSNRDVRTVTCPYSDVF
jgi:hypothetical protein